MILFNKTARRAALSGCAVAALCASATASAQQVYSFGDSLSDVGNVNDYTFGLVAGGDYFDGRFSNGYLWTDYLSFSQTGELQRKNPGLIGPLFTRTTRPYNFAHGGAVSGELSSDVDTGLLSGLGFLSNLGAFRVTEQARHFRDLSFFGPSFRASSSDFATISAGGNDYFAGETNVGRVVGNTFRAAGYIHDRGIRNFIILDVPNVGDTPANFGTADQAQLNALSAQHNVEVRSAAGSFENQRSGSLVAVVPAARMFDLITQDALFNGGGTYGFTTVRPGTGTSGYCLGDGLVLSACPSSYLFYDDIHPTASAHALLADLAAASWNNRVWGLSEPLTRSAASKQVSTQSSQVVANRVAALRLGLTGSGRMVDPMSAARFDGIGAGNLSFQHVPGQVPGQAKLSVFGFAEGTWSELLAQGRGERARETLARESLHLQPGEAAFTMGADLLVNEGLAFGGTMSRGVFDRQRFTTRSLDETTAVSVYGVMFDGPWTHLLSASSTNTDQDTRRRTGFHFQPDVYSQSETDLRELTFETNYRFGFGRAELTAIGRVAGTTLDLRSFGERGSLGLFDRQVGSETITGYSGYMGLRADIGLFERRGAGRLSLEAGPVAGTSRMLGYASVLGDPLLFGTLPEEVSYLAPVGDLERAGFYSSASLRLLSTDRMSLAARAAAVDTASRTDSVVELNFGLRF